jgi:hypothetical protein
VITDTQTSIQRPSGLRRQQEAAQRSTLVRLLKDHFVAKLVALLFAGVLVLLIDREVTSTVVDAELFEVRVGDLPRGAPAPGQRVIMLEKEPGVAIRALRPNPVRVTIRGQQKLIEHMKTTALVGRVSVKKDWLPKDKDGALSPTTQAIDGQSINFGFGATVKLDEPIQVDLDPEVTHEVRLEAAPKDVVPGLVAEVVFQPAAVKVFGPSTWLKGPGAIDRITIPITAAGRTAEYNVLIPVLPEEYLQRQIRMVPGQQVFATVRFSPGEQVGMDVKDVPFKFSVTPQVNDEYKFAPIGLGREVVTVTVGGTADAIAAWKEKPDELRKLIRVEIDGVKLVAKVAPNLTEPGSHTDEAGDVEVLKLPDNLKLVGVAPAQVEVTITKR